MTTITGHSEGWTVAAERRSGRLARFLRGRPEDPRWARPGLLALLAATALLYLADLSASGWANAYYSAAVQAGSHSWKAFFFGSFDASSFITVDKPPVSLWAADLSARLFGVNAWSLLVPQALEGVATVGLLYATVRRRFGAASGLLAGGMLALTPVAVLMFRYNNPDAMLVLLLVAAAYAVVRAAEAASPRWLALGAALVGFGFLTKMLQALLVVPAFALAYLIAAPASLRRRIMHLALAGAALLVAGGWWVAVVQLWPASSRPYIGGSQDDSLLNLIFGYNGLGRLTGSEAGSVGGGRGGGGAGFSAGTGPFRLLGAANGGQIAWLLPAAAIFVIALLWMGRRLPRTDQRRAQLILWAVTLLVTGATFSYMAGIYHPYYTLALAPSIAALAGIGAVSLWPQRHRPLARAVLASAVLLTGVWAFALLDRSPAWYPWLRIAVLAGSLLAAGAIAAGPALGRRLAGAVAVAALVVTMAAPAAYALQTAATPHSGAIPSAGPAVTAGFGGGPGGGFGGARPGFAPPGAGTGLPPGAGSVPAGRNSGTAPGGTAAGGQGGPPGLGGQRPAGGAAAGQRGGLGGLLGASTPSSALVRLLKTGSARYTWAAATVRANNAAGIQLATGLPIMAIGGFNGTDPAPTLAGFEQLVRQGKIRYFVAQGGGGSGGPGGAGNGDSSKIASWVAGRFRSATVGGVTVYDLTRPLTAGKG